jgi:phosphoglycerate dehydrogenase-like enzyme
MAKPGRIVIASEIGTHHLAQVRAAANGREVVAVEPFAPGDALDPALVPGTAVLVSDSAPANLAAMTDLRLFQLGSAGYQQLSGLLLAQLGVRVANASGVNDVPIAEWCLLMMLIFERDLPGLLRAQADRVWDRRSKFQAELRGKRVGILGYGNIGRQVARISTGAGLDVWAMNRTPIGPVSGRFVPAGTGDPDGTLPSRRFGFTELDAFLPALDYLVLTTALNPRTVGMLGARELRLLPAHAVLVNPARAHLVDEAALEQALREGWIAGAAIDSHYREPMQPDDPVWEWPNVVLTPHISGSTLSPHREDRLWELVASNVARLVAGEQLLNEVPLADIG